MTNEEEAHPVDATSKRIPRKNCWEVVGLSKAPTASEKDLCRRTNGLREYAWIRKRGAFDFGGARYIATQISLSRNCMQGQAQSQEKKNTEENKRFSV